MLFMKTNKIKVGDTVNFNPYPEENGRVGTLGKVKRIGTPDELGMFSMVDDDDRIYYELLDLKGNVFTRTSINWITKVK